MKRVLMLLLLAALLTGCADSADNKSEDANTNASAGISPTESVTEPEEDSQWVEAIDSKIPKTMNLYKNISFEYKEEQWKVKMYSSADIDEDGELMLDDRCKFIIRVISPEGKYEIFNDYVQLGVPSVDVFTDEDSILHLIVDDRQTASYSSREFVYDEDQKKFTDEPICSYSNINLIADV